MKNLPSLRSSFLSTILVVSLAGIANANATESSELIEPKATQLLRNSLDFLAAQQSFTVQGNSYVEFVMENGQKIQMNQSANLAVQRPNKLRATRIGDEITNEFFYNGSNFTVFNANTGFFATATAPNQLDGALQFAFEKMDVVSPAGDLIFTNAYERLMQGVTSGFVVGKSVINGQACDHLAFRGKDTDWQIWLASGSKPLPCKMVITTKDVLNAPQFSVEMKSWALNPKFKASKFEFKAPKNARKIEFLPANTTSAQ